MQFVRILTLTNTHTLLRGHCYFGRTREAMQLSDADTVFVGFILYISGILGQKSSICILRGSLVNLPCSDQHLTESMKWYTLLENNSKFVLNELYKDDLTYNMSAESNYNLTIKAVRESDAKLYCCKETADNPDLCWQNRIELRVADLQVKVIPATEGEMVTLMCRTSCPLTEKPAAYIWYKNREFLYEDWSPWYQELVSSEEAVSYSCAVKGYEDLRAPEVSVDSVTPTCFSVTYAKGRMCSNQTSVDESCSITYPRDMHVQMTRKNNYFTLTCNTSCPVAEPHTAFTWYWNRKVFFDCQSQDVQVFGSYGDSISCALKNNEDLHSDDICFHGERCWKMNYDRVRICELEGSSVNITSTNSYRSTGSWSKIKRSDEEDDGAQLLFLSGTTENYPDLHGTKDTLMLDNVQRNDSAEYKLNLVLRDRSDLPGVLLVVTGLKVTVNPSAVVTEGQRVTLTCSTSCPLPGDTNYIWYFNGRPLNLKHDQSKHLLLDPVSSEDEGNYSCAVESPQNISSHEKALTVEARGDAVAHMNVVKLAVLFLVLPAVFLLYWTRCRGTVAATAGPSDKGQPGQMDSQYEAVRLKAVNPAPRRDPAVQQEDHV